MPLSQSQLNHIGIVSEDLQFLANLDPSGPPNRVYIRAVSAVLRRLLIDNKLSQAAQWLDGMSDFQVEIFDIDYVLDLPSTEYLFYEWSPPYAGTEGASAAQGFGTFRLPSAVVQQYGSVEAAQTAIFPTGQPSPKRRTVGLGQLKRSLSMVRRIGPTQGIVRISREDEIKFVANDLGGVHINSFGEPPSSDLIAIRGATWAIKKQVMREPLIEVAGVHWSLFDVWSTGLVLGKSSQAAEFTERFHALPQVTKATGDPNVLRFWSPEGKIEEVRFGPADAETQDHSAAGH